MNVSRIKRIENRVLKNKVTHPIRLEIGCGENKIDSDGKIFSNKLGDGYIGLDIIDYGQDILWDVELGIPLPDDSCLNIYSSHTFEHLGDFIGVMNECWRVLKKGGELYVVVPHRDNEKAYVPSHVRWFDKWSWDFFQYPSYAEGYQSKVWKVTELITNERKDMHVKLTPVGK